jgi:hypothetical protein
MVTLIPILEAMLSLKLWDTVGASKLNMLFTEPTNDDIVTPSLRLGPTYPPAVLPLAAQLTVVLDDQEEVVHTSSVICAVGVRLEYPKFSPEIVTEVPPEAAAFAWEAPDKIGESYDHLCTRVPTTAETVTAVDRPSPPCAPDCVLVST